MVYQPIHPPFPQSSLPGRSLQEAEAYFAWFMGEFPNRLDQLQAHFENTGGDRALLDFSPPP